MKNIIKVIGIILSIIGGGMCLSALLGAIILKQEGKSIRQFLKDTYNYGYDYLD